MRQVICIRVIQHAIFRARTTAIATQIRQRIKDGDTTFFSRFILETPDKIVPLTIILQRLMDFYRAATQHCSTDNIGDMARHLGKRSHHIERVCLRDSAGRIDVSLPELFSESRRRKQILLLKVDAWTPHIFL